MKYLRRTLALGAIAVAAIATLAGCEAPPPVIHGVVCKTSFTPEGATSFTGDSTPAQFSAMVLAKEGFVTVSTDEYADASEANTLHSAVVPGEVVSFVGEDGSNAVSVDYARDVTVEKAKASMEDALVVASSGRVHVTPPANSPLLFCKVELRCWWGVSNLMNIIIKTVMLLPRFFEMKDEGLTFDFNAH